MKVVEGRSGEFFSYSLKWDDRVIFTVSGKDGEDNIRVIAALNIPIAADEVNEMIANEQTQSLVVIAASEIHEKLVNGVARCAKK